MSIKLLIAIAAISLLVLSVLIYLIGILIKKVWLFCLSKVKKLTDKI